MLAEKPMITFGEESLSIRTNTEYEIYNLKDVAKFTYEVSEEQGIRNLESDKASSFKFDGEMLLFPSLKTGSTVAIHTLNGTIVFRKTIEADGDYSFPLSHLNKGVYMVSVDGLTYKILAPSTR